jgi:hypothetical protein
MYAVFDSLIVIDPTEDGYGFSVFRELTLADLVVVAMIEKALAVYLKFQINFS